MDYIQNKWSILNYNQYNPSLALSVIFNYTSITFDNYSFVSNKFRIKNMAKIEVGQKKSVNFR